MKYKSLSIKKAITLSIQVWAAVFCVNDTFAFGENVNLLTTEVHYRLSPPVSLANPIDPVKGKVVDDKTGQPLVGVVVKVKGTSTVTRTDTSGLYILEVPDESSLLIFSFVGYQQLETAVSKSRELNVSLKEEENQLNNVVVIGYGKQKRTLVTSAIVSANLEAVKDAPNTNIIQSLQGNIPGLNVGPVTSAGATPSISVRGRNTVNGNANVLIILDGVQYNSSLSSINPDDIASIDLLKDASATAVYGAQAANGVLLITSRKGNSGKPRINFTSSYTTQSPSGNIRPMNREEYLNKVRDLYYDQAYLSPGYTEPNPAFNIANYVDILMRDGSNLVPTNFDWYEAATKTGHIYDNQLSISGSSDKVNYLISGGYTNQSGYIINDLFKRKSLRINLETQATDWAKVGVQAFGSFVNSDGAEPTLSAIFQMSPLQTPFNADGTYNPFPFNSVNPNPFLTYDVTDFERHNYLFANVYGEAKLPFLPGLTYRVNFGNNGRIDKKYFASKYASGQTGQAYKTNEHYYDYTLDNILTYDKVFGKHTVNATLLYGAVERQHESSTGTGTGFTRLTLGYNDLSQATTQRTTSSAYNEALNYQMARLAYSYGGRYLVTATARRDGYSAFAANNKWGVFPSLSAGWILSEESFIRNISFINFLKLRGGYGISGNQTSRYASLDRVETQPAYVFGDGGTTVFGQFIGTLPNPDLRWEKTHETNIGTDFTILKGRLSGTFDIYSRNTTDLLFTVQIPNITGYSSINTNVGEVGNKGFELSLSSRNIDLKNFSWNSTINFSRNRSKIKELLGNGDLISTGLFIGKRFGSIFGYQTDGIYQIGDQIPAGYSAGTFRIIDFNGDGTVNSNDRSILGSSEPAYRFSVLNSIRYKDLSLTFLINSIQGGKDGYMGSNSPSLGRSDVSVREGGIAGINYWTPANPTGEYSLYTGAGPTIGGVRYEKRNFVRLQDVTLSYKLPTHLLSLIKMQNVSVFASGKNLKTWTNWRGWDPEIDNGGLNTSGRPLLIGYSFGLNITL